MREFATPRVFVSRCIEHDHCRYNGNIIASEAVRNMQGKVDIVTTCPEADIGLGIPRDPIRVVKKDDKLRLMQPATERDVTREMVEFSGDYLDNLGEIDGFVLKADSPSCGPDNVKIYPSTDKVPPLDRGAGFFASEVARRFADTPSETEGRLTNFTIRENFYTQIYALADFRASREKGGKSDLVDFHARNKFLIMSYSEEDKKRLGRIVANQENRGAGELFEEYEKELRGAFCVCSRVGSNINVLMHALGYFKEELSSEEKNFFLENLESYREDKIPLSVPLNIMRSLIIRFDQDYLAGQTFFEPYPEGLVEITDSGKGRKLR